MKIIVFAIILFSPLFLSQSIANEELPDGYQYVFPYPSSKYVHPNATIILRFENISPKKLENLNNLIKVSGELSGHHPGTTFIASDNQTVIFESERSYELGENVKVTITPLLSEFDDHIINPLNYEFTVLEEIITKTLFPDEEKDNISIQKKSTAFSMPMIMSNGVSVPADFPHVNITHNNNPSSDFIFLNNYGPPYYNIIFNTSGAPVWYWKTSDLRSDFKVQSNGWITMQVEDGYEGSGVGYIALNQNFKYIKSFRAVNGYTTDTHELFILPDSGYFLIGRRETTVDMSQYVTGGQNDATVRETCIQEFTADDQLIFIWRAWDHFDIRDVELEDLTGSFIRFPHMNAIYTDEDGHILLSSRRLSEISKIHRLSGEFIWRMIGVPDALYNDLQFVNDPLDGFRNQHTIRSQGNNHYTLFDNGNLHSPPVSRAVEYEIDLNQMTATLVWEYRNELNSSFSSTLGNSQRLPNGNTHINWGVGEVLPIATEVTPDGEKIFEMWFEKGYRCYRSFRHPWEGKCNVPYLLLEPQIDNLALIFNKFGDENIDYFNIYADTVPNPITLLDTSHNTLKQLIDLENGLRYYFRVTAVDKNGIESGYSNEENIVANISPPGSNLILNGDFTNILDSWTLELASSASADVKVDNGVCNFVIQNGGTELSDVQLRQNNILLIQGQNYIFEFDAWAEGSRYVEIKVGEDSSPYTDYSRIGYTALSSTLKRYTFAFEMQESTDNNASVVINAGLDTHDIYIDNLSLKIDLNEKKFFDLAVSVPSEIFSCFVGDTIEIEYTIENLHYSSLDSAKIRYYLSDDETINHEDILLDTNVLLSINVGESIEIKDSLAIPDSIEAGNYVIIISINENSLLYDIDSSNNVAFLYYKIKPADLSNSLWTLPTIRISPNPTSGIIYVKSASKLKSYKLINNSGQIVRNEMLDGLDELSINIEDLPSGFYLLLIKAGNQVEELSFKVIKE